MCFTKKVEEHQLLLKSLPTSQRVVTTYTCMIQATTQSQMQVWKDGETTNSKTLIPLTVVEDSPTIQGIIISMREIALMMVVHTHEEIDYDTEKD